MEDNMSVGFALRRILKAQEVLARYRVGDPEITYWDASKAGIVFRYNRRKLGDLLRD